MRHVALLLALAISMGTVACKKSAAAATPAPAVSITISLTATQTLLANQTVAFTATVSNTTNAAVTWQVNGVVGGDIADGTISTTGLYTAPANIISEFPVTVTVVSSADSTMTASTAILLTPPPPISVSPTSATLAAGATQQFTASTTPPNAAVTWEVNGIVGGNSTVGTVTQAGLYTAPQVPPSSAAIPIKAILQSNTTEFSVATVTITYGNSSLQHSYGFLLRGTDPSGLLLRAGSFHRRWQRQHHGDRGHQ